jgi:hypothetical protein
MSGYCSSKRCRAVGLEGFRSDLGTSGFASGSLPAGLAPGGLGTVLSACTSGASALWQSSPNEAENNSQCSFERTRHIE